jgi:hypothetical protein
MAMLLVALCSRESSELRGDQSPNRTADLQPMRLVFLLKVNIVGRLFSLLKNLPAREGLTVGAENR